MSAPLVSFIIATRNSALALPRCLDSLRAQRLRDFEVLVADGASTDGTVELLRASGDVVTWWRSGPDEGLYDAWNRAVPRARGEWIAFLGADDRLWDADALARLAPHLREAPRDRPVVYSRVRQVLPDGELVAELGEPWERAKASFRSYRCLPHPGLMHRAALFAERGLFDTSFRIAADYELLLRELKEGDAVFAPVLTVAMGFGGVSARPELLALQYAEIERALRRHGLRPPPVRWVAWKGMARVYACLHRLLGERSARRVADLYRMATLRRGRYARS